MELQRSLETKGMWKKSSNTSDTIRNRIIPRMVMNAVLWRLGCNMEAEAARVAYDAMRG